MTPPLPAIPEEERAPAVVALLEIIQKQQELIQQLRDEIARLKGLKPKPRIKPSRLENNAPDPEKENKPGGKRPGSAKRAKTPALQIHEEKIVAPAALPAGSTLLERRDWVVQELVIEPHNTRYWIERWRTPAGEVVVGELPPAVAASHFGPSLASFILYQYYHGRVTQPLLVEQLHEFGIDISTGCGQQYHDCGQTAFPRREG
jgi:hypothetical protein